MYLNLLNAFFGGANLSYALCVYLYNNHEVNIFSISIGVWCSIMAILRTYYFKTN
jgi:hypothetical protein